VTSVAFSYSFGESEIPVQEGGQYCVTWHVASPFSVKTAKRQISWTPSPGACDCAGCQTALNDWQATIAAHEDFHEFEARRLTALANESWNLQPNLPYKRCGKNPTTVTKRLRAQIVADLRKEKERLERDNKQATKDFHKKTALGHDLPSPCTQCAPCPTGSGVLSMALQAGECAVCCNASECETCDSATGTCVSRCSACEMCQGGGCVDMCGAGTHCENGACVTDCTACEIYETTTHTCVSTCLDCETCQNGTCVSVDCECQGITCDECMHCEGGLCVRTCTDTEVCCGDQCINPSQYKCCITRDNGSVPCPPDYHCCASGQCCLPNEQCCGGQCVPYDTTHCANCFPCGANQVCCIGPQGQIYGCTDPNSCN
jgi:hypothetical protein